MKSNKNVKEVQLYEKYMLFRSCSISNKCPGIEVATKYAFSELDILLDESDEHTCCGGNAIIFSSIGQVNSTILMTARNLAVAEEKELNIVTMCNGCYKNLNEFGEYIVKNPEVMNSVNDKLREINREYNGKSKVYHVMEVLYSKRSDIAKKAKYTLNGLKFAIHYGCHYSFGAKDHAIDDSFSTSTMEEMIEMLGGEIVNYTEEKTCCGSGILNNTYVNKELAMSVAERKFESLNSTEADAVIVMCPYCMMTLDRMQLKFHMSMGKKYIIPVLHIAQIISLAMGAAPANLGFETNLTSLEGFMKKWEGLHA